MRECPKCSTELPDQAGGCPKCGQQLQTGVAREAEPQLDIERTLRSIGGWLSGVVKHYWPMLLAGVLFVAMQWSFPLVDWWKTWTRQNSYSSHGPLVPLIALFMVWANRKRIAVTKISPSWWGLALIVPAIVLFEFGRWTGSGNICAITFIMFLIGAVLMFVGSRMTRLLLFPMLYLLFMVPPPGMLLDRVTSRVQISSTTFAAKLLSATGKVVGDSEDGWEIRQSGTIISSPRFPADPHGGLRQLRVEGECSGFRMLISLITFTAFFVYMLRAEWWKKAILVLISFPLSLFVNGLRIAAIGYVGIWTENFETMISFHNSWAMVFELVLSFAILFGIARLMKANDFGIPDPNVNPAEAAQADSTPRYRLVGRGLRGPAVIALFCVVLIANSLIKPLEVSARGHLNRSEFPRHFSAWSSEDAKADEITANELKTADMLDRVYFCYPTDPQAVVVTLIAAQDTDAFHDPHSCLPGGGNSIDLDKIITIRFTKPRPMSVRATFLRFSSKTFPDGGLMVYWYSFAGKTYAGSGDIRLALRNAQVRRSLGGRQAYHYRFTTSANYQDTDEALARLIAFIKEFVANSSHFK